MLNLLVNLMILFAVVAVLYWLATLIQQKLPDPLKWIPMVFVALFALMMLLSLWGVWGDRSWRGFTIVR
jgi:hypothetical protein